MGRYATHLGCIKGSHALVGQDTVVLLAMDTEDRGVPFADKEVRRIGKSALCNLVLLIPIGTAHVPVGEPFLLSLEVLHFHIEDTVVCNEGLEALVMMTSQPINAEATEGGTYATQAIFVGVWLVGYKLINGSEIVLHALSSVVATNLFVPLVAETRQAAAVRCHNDIIVGSHHHEVPAETPELTYGRLWTTFAVEQGRIFLIWVKMRRINDPCEHLFAIGGLLPTRNNCTHGDL